MNSKTLLKAISLLFVLICGTYVSMSYQKQQNIPEAIIGTPVFDKALNHTENINKISFQTSKSHFDLIMKDNYWRISQEDDYYAGTTMVNNLLSQLKNTVYYAKQKATPELLQKYGLHQDSKGDNIAQIKLYSKGQLLESINLGHTTNNGLYTYAYRPESDEIWLITGVFTLPQESYSWLQQPLFSYAPEQIKSIVMKKNDQKFIAARLNPKQPFVNQDFKEARVDLLLEDFRYFIFQKVKNKQHFDFSKFPQKKEIKIITFSGLVNEITLYSNQKEYWISSKLSSLNLSNPNIDEYIENNKILFENWIFELPELSGKILFGVGV